MNQGLHTLLGLEFCHHYTSWGVAKSQAEATFYHFACTYLVHVKLYPSNIKYILIRLHSTLSIQAIIP